MPIPLGHIRIHITRAARINQPLPTALLLLPRQRLGAGNTSRLTDRVGCAGEPSLLLAALLDGGGEVTHDSRDVVFRLGREEAGAYFVGVLVKCARGGGDVDEAASGF